MYLSISLSVVLACPAGISPALGQEPPQSHPPVHTTDEYGANGDAPPRVRYTFPPYPTGVVLPDKMITATAERSLTRPRDGSHAPEWGTDLDEYWGFAVLDASAPRVVSKSRMVYDPYAARVVQAALARPRSAGSALLIRTGTETIPLVRETVPDLVVHEIDIDPDDLAWGEDLNVGFNKDWIVVQVNLFAIAGGQFARTHIYVIDKARLYAGELAYTLISDTTIGGSQVPALTYDAGEPTVYLVQNWNGNQQGHGYLRLYAITGPVGMESLKHVAFVEVADPWADSHPIINGGFAPQLGSDRRLMLGDSRVQSVVFRNNALWAAHAVFLPADAPARAAVQWWQLSTIGAIVQRGRIDGGPDDSQYGYPSLAVNDRNDMLVGFAQFSNNDLPSGAYAYRSFRDPLHTTRAPFRYMGSHSAFTSPGPNGTIPWAGFSTTLVDPVNDLDFWTLQTTTAVPQFIGGAEVVPWMTVWAYVNVPRVEALSGATSGPSLAGEPVAWTAHASLVPDLQYQFSAQKPGSGLWTVIQNFGASNVCTWTPDEGGTHTMRVRLRYVHAGVEFEDEKTTPYTVIARPAEIVALTSSSSAPTVGSSITWIVSARFGTAALEYSFWRYDVRTDTWTEVQAYGPSASYTWTPAASEAGRYVIQAWVRSTGGGELDDYAATDYITVRGGALTLAGDPVHGMPAQTGNSLSWAVHSWGGAGVPEYQFAVFDAATAVWTPLQDYGRANSVTWIPDRPGTYRLRARARIEDSGSGGFDAETETANFDVAIGPVIVTALTADRLLPAVAGDTITWTAGARGGDGIDYRFVLHDMATDSHVIQEWGPAAAFRWEVPTPGHSSWYAVEVWARSAGAVAPFNGYRSSPLFIIAAGPGPLSELALHADVKSPIAPGTPITFTASLPQAAPGLLYRFSLQTGADPEWTVLREYASERTLIWTPTGSDIGPHKLRVEIKQPGSANPFDALATTSVTVSTGDPAIVVLLDRSPGGVVTTNTPVEWVASGTGGMARLQYRYWLFDGTSWKILRDYSTDPRALWTPPVEATGTYVVQVWARRTGSEASYEAFAVSEIEVQEPLALTALTPTPAPAFYDQAYAWKASAAGGKGPLQFQFVMEDSTGSRVVQDFSECDVYHWLPRVPGLGAHTLYIYAKNALTGEAQGSISVPVNVSYPPFVVALTTDRTLPAVIGTPITWTVTVSGGVPPLAYEFWRYDVVAKSWSLGRPAGPSPTYTWTPDAQGRYEIHVAIYSTLVAVARTWVSSDYFTVGGGALTIAAIETTTALPAQTGQPAGWQAIAFGGSGAIDYRFDVFDVAHGTWSVLRDYASREIAVWTPVAPGSFAIRVRARAVGSAAEFEAERLGPVFDVVAGPIRFVSLSADQIAPFRAVTPVTWTAVATGGTGAYEYRFVMHDFDDPAAIEQPFGTSATFVWPGGQDAHTYLLEAWVRSSGSSGAADAYGNSGHFSSSLYGFVADALFADVYFPAPPGTPVTWTAVRVSRPPDAQFRFDHWTPSTGWEIVRDYSPSRTFVWTPGAADLDVQHQMRWVSGGITHDSAYFTITSQPPWIERFSCTPASAPAGAPVRCWVVARGGTAPREYRFWRYDVTRATWVMIRDYDISPTMTWYPGAEDHGEHVFQVWLRSAGLPVSFERWTNSSTISIRSGPPEATLSTSAEEGAWTSTFEFTASLASGSEPVEYEFSRQAPAGEFVVVRPYDRSPWYIWKPSFDSVPPAAGMTPYTIRVRLRSATTRAVLATAERTVIVQR